jgi:hypothetical protein
MQGALEIRWAVRYLSLVAHFWEASMFRPLLVFVGAVAVLLAAALVAPTCPTSDASIQFGSVLLGGCR